MTVAQDVKNALYDYLSLDTSTTSNIIGQSFTEVTGSGGSWEISAESKLGDGAWKATGRANFNTTDGDWADLRGGSALIWGWVKLPSAPTSVKCPLFYKWGTDASTVFQIGVQTSGAIRVIVGFSDGSSEFFDSSSTIPTGEYFFFALTWDASAQRIELWLNDASVGSKTASTGTDLSAPFGGTQTEIGYVGTSAPVTQHIDGLGLATLAADQDVIDYLYNGGTGLTLSQLQLEVQPPTDEEIFEASFEDASGRDPLPTALLERTPAKRLANHNVIVYKYPPYLVTKSLPIELDDYNLIRPGNMIWHKDENSPLFSMGRWAQIQGRRFGDDPTHVELTLRISDHPESFTEPT